MRKIYHSCFILFFPRPRQRKRQCGGKKRRNEKKTKGKKKNQTKDKRVQSMGPEWNAETHQRQKKRKTVSMKISVACVGLRWRVRLVSFRFFYSIAILLFFVFFSSSVGLLLSDGFGRGQRVLLLRFGVFQFGRIERFDALAQLLLALLLGDHCR